MTWDLVTLARDLVALPSHQGEQQVQDYVADCFRRLGMTVRLQEVFPGRANVIARRGSGGPLLCSHADTFPPYRHPDPFTLQRADDRVIGRGIVDTKGQIAALLMALSQSTGPCEVAITVDEERTGQGSLVLEPEARAAVVLEPTDLAICPVQAGFFEAELTVTGTAAHETVPHAGKNAILAAIDAYRAIIALEHFQAEHPLLGRPWTTLGTIQGGHEIGTVPSHCIIHFDVGIWPDVSLEQVEADIRQLIEPFDAKLRVVDKSLGFELAEEHALVQQLSAAVQRAGREAALGGMPSWTDAQNLHLKGIAAVVFGAGQLGAAHSDREWVAIDDLGVVVEALKIFIDRWTDPADHANPNAVL